MSINLDKELVVVTTAGSVDDGKSTLIGRLLYDCNDIYEDQILALKKKSGTGELNKEDLAFLTDGLEAEREQKITIDVAYRHFSRPNRKFIIADVPGHEQYTRNMVTGASKADLAIIIVDARKGVLFQSKRHLFVSSLLGIHHIVIAVNKMDLVGYAQEVFENIRRDFAGYAAKMGIHDLQFIPISALEGDMVVKRKENMEWYDGPTLLSYLENVQISSGRNLIDFRLPVQYVIRPNQDFRGYAGKIEGGVIKVGDEVKILPSGKETRVKEIYLGNKKVEYAFDPQSVALCLEKEIDISRGDMIVRKENLPLVGNGIEAMVSWFSERPLVVGKKYLIKHTSRVLRAEFEKVRYAMDIESLHRVPTEELKFNEIGRVVLKANGPLYFDAYSKNKNTGCFIVIDELTNETIGAGIILEKGKASEEKNDREVWQTNKGAVLWFTGLSGAGKTTIARELFDLLRERQVKVEMLDGDELREHLTKDLGFSKEDRDENIRRVGFVADLLSRNGVIVIASFISPYRRQREELRGRVSNFVEIHVNTPLEICEKRDVKGMYAKARRGEIPNFTGVSDPYEEPENPHIRVCGDNEENMEKIISDIVGYLKGNEHID